MEMQIRHLAADDYAAVMDLWLRAGLSTLRPQGRDSRESFFRQLGSDSRCQNDQEPQTVLGLEAGNQLIGVIIATHDGRKGWINRLAIDPEYRRKGYAKRLIEAAEDSLKAQGISVIAALIKSDNRASKDLFCQAGYQYHHDVHYFSKRDSTEA